MQARIRPHDLLRGKQALHALPGSGESSVAVSASISGLTAKTTYHFRVVAKNAGGESKGADETLKTLPNAPTVKTEKASEVAQTTAKLNASVNPNGGEVTECKLEYGPTTSYGESKPCSPPRGPGESSVAVSASISGLTANTHLPLPRRRQERRR